MNVKNGLSASSRSSSRGFTLLEVTVTIILAAVLGVMLYHLMSRGLINSAISLNRLKAAQVLNLVMDRITADYKDNLNNSDPPQDLVAFMDGLSTQAYGADEVSLSVGGLQPDPDDETTFVECTLGNAGCTRIAQVTLTLREQSMVGLFTE